MPLGFAKNGINRVLDARYRLGSFLDFAKELVEPWLCSNLNAHKKSRYLIYFK